MPLPTPGAIQSTSQRRMARMSRAVSRNHGRTVYLRPPPGASSSITFSATGPAARQPAAVVEYAATASVADDANSTAQGAAVGDRMYEVDASTLGTPREGPPGIGWTLRDPALADNGSLGVLQITAAERGADGAVLRLLTRRSR
jgi:hypothetical protein